MSEYHVIIILAFGALLALSACGNILIDNDSLVSTGLTAVCDGVQTYEILSDGTVLYSCE